MDDYSILIIGAIALVVFWLVFSLIRKMFGLVLLVGVAAGAWVLWNNPEMFQHVWAAAMGLAGQR